MTKDKHKKLAQLGADVLATTLLDLANFNHEAECVVDRLLASPKENTKSFQKRLSSVIRRKHFISRGEAGAYARDLVSMLEGLQAEVSDPRAGVEAVTAFFEADSHILTQIDDANGSVGNVLRLDAAELFSSYASRCEEKAWLADLIIRLYQSDNFGVRDVLFEKMADFLPREHLYAVVEKLWLLEKSASDQYDGRHWLFAIESLANQLQDPDLLAKAKGIKPGGEASVSNIIELANLHLAKGDLSAAVQWAQRLSLDSSYMESERDQLLIAIYKKQGNKKKLTETALKVFKRDRDMDSLQMLVEIVGEERRTAIIEEVMKAILKEKEFDDGDAIFLIECGCVNEAEQYILARSKQLDCDLFANLLPLAKLMVKQEKIVAASVIYRALLDSNLRAAKSANYHRGISYLKKLNLLAVRVKDWQKIQPHSDYLANLRQKHRLKSSFWSQCRKS